MAKKKQSEPKEEVKHEQESKEEEQILTFD